jgi:hypothetical protein
MLKNLGIGIALGELAIDLASRYPQGPSKATRMVNLETNLMKSQELALLMKHVIVSRIF